MSFTIDHTNWQSRDKINEIVLGVNERSLAARRTSLFSDTSTYGVTSLVGYEGKIYQCTVATSGPGSWTSQSGNWREFLVEEGSDLQGIRYTVPGSYQLDWWGWDKMQEEIEQICTRFIRSFVVDEKESIGVGGSITPAWNNTYGYFGTLYNGEKLYVPDELDAEVWYDGSQYVISETRGDKTNEYFIGSGGTVTGTYTAQNGATGSPSVSIRTPPVDDWQKHTDFWNQTKLFNDIRVETEGSTNLFQSGDWTRINPAGTFSGQCQVGDYITGVMIAEIVACLEKLQITWIPHRAPFTYYYDTKWRGFGKGFDPICTNAKTDYDSDWAITDPSTSSLETMYQCQAKHDFGGGNFTFEARRIDSKPRTPTDLTSFYSVPKVNGIGGDYLFYACSDQVYNTSDFAVPPDAPDRGDGVGPAYFTDWYEMRPLISGSWNAGDQEIISPYYIGNDEREDGVDEYGIGCGTLEEKELSVRSGVWVLDWDFTN